MHVPIIHFSPSLGAVFALFAMAICFHGATVSSAAEVTRLSLVKDAEFPEWLTGTEWEFAPKQGKRRLWFAAPCVVIYSRVGETGPKAESGYSFTIQKKGVVRIYPGNSTAHPLDLTVAEDLKAGSVYNVEAKDRTAATMTGRRFLPPTPDMKEAEFKSWLKCKLLGIPSKNAIHATDLVLTEGLKPFLGIQVFSLTKFDDALSVARADKAADVAAAISDFTGVAKVAARNPQSLRAPDSIARLKSILQRAPGHLSAAILLQYATDKLPGSLSPSGSLSELDQAIGDLNTAISGDLAATNKLDSGQIARARSGLQRLRPLADSRVRPLVDAWVEWGNLADKFARTTSPASEASVKEWRATISRIHVEDEKLRSNESFRESLK